jgi:hypothetical protein
MNIVIPDDDPDMGDQRECYSLIRPTRSRAIASRRATPAQLVERGKLLC